MYAVVIGYDKKTDTVKMITMDDNLETFTSKPTDAPLSDLAMICLKYKFKPYNFSLNRLGEVVQDSGAFSRLHKQSAIVLAEFLTKRGAKVGYRLLYVNGKFINRKVDDIITKDALLGEDTPLLQNAIISNNTVRCFANHNFKTITLGADTNTAKTAQPQTQTKEPDTEIDAPLDDSVEPETDINISVAEDKDPYTKGQRREIKACRNKGIDSTFIENPALSERQMRILWVSKGRGALSENFNQPEYSTDVMEFYATRLKDVKTVKMCRPILDHPEYSLEKVEVMYNAIMSGVNPKDLVGKTISDIEVATIAKDSKMWGKPQEINIGRMKADREFAKLKQAYDRKQLDACTPEEVQAELDDYFKRHPIASDINKISKALEKYRKDNNTKAGTILGVSVIGVNQYDIKEITSKDAKHILEKIKEYRKAHPEDKSVVFSVKTSIKRNTKTGEMACKPTSVTPIPANTVNQDMQYATLV